MFCGPQLRGSIGQMSTSICTIYTPAKTKSWPDERVEPRRAAAGAAPPHRYQAGAALHTPAWRSCLVRVALQGSPLICTAPPLSMQTVNTGRKFVRPVQSAASTVPPRSGHLTLNCSYPPTFLVRLTSCLPCIHAKLYTALRCPHSNSWRALTVLLLRITHLSIGYKLAALLTIS